MRQTIYHILLSIVSLLAFAGCDVHEFPVDNHERIPFLLNLDFSTELPLYKEVEYTRGGEVDTKSPSDQHDMRYIIKAYRTDNRRSESRDADTTFVFTKSDIREPEFTAPLSLPEGTYTFRVWADHINAGETGDKYYNTGDFSEIILADKKEHSGSNDYRDAFRGYAQGTVTNPELYTGDFVSTIDNTATAQMQRPMGKFKFISTDVDIFLTRIVQMMREKEMQKSASTLPALDKATYNKLLQEIHLEDFEVVFKYNHFMPCSFNMFTDKPADSWTGISFSSRMHSEEENEVTLGHDYIFVNGAETTLSVSVEVYNKEGELMSRSNPINVPVVRSKMTIVKGKFLTSKATGGVSINPGYDGEDYNIEIKW